MCRMQIMAAASSRTRPATTGCLTARIQNRMTTPTPIRYNETKARQLMDIRDFMLDGGQ